MRDLLSSPVLSALPMRSSNKKSRSKSKSKSTSKNSSSRGALAVATAAVVLSLAGCAFLPGGGSAVATGERPEGFVALKSVAPSIAQDLRNQGSNNLLGRPLAGYEAPVCLLTTPAAKALQAVQASVQRHGLALKVFDCYRPQAAVDDLLRWSRDSRAPENTKAAYYPEVPKAQLEQRGFITPQSSHSRGSAVDLTLVVTDAVRAAQVLQGPLAQREDVDMGTPYGLMDPSALGHSDAVSPDVKHNRAWLRGQMQLHGLVPEDGRWWHYRLQKEPHPKQAFDFPVR